MKLNSENKHIYAHVILDEIVISNLNTYHKLKSFMPQMCVKCYERVNLLQIFLQKTHSPYVTVTSAYFALVTEAKCFAVSSSKGLEQCIEHLFYIGYVKPTNDAALMYSRGSFVTSEVVGCSLVSATGKTVVVWREEI